MLLSQKIDSQKTLKFVTLLWKGNLYNSFPDVIEKLPVIKRNWQIL